MNEKIKQAKDLRELAHELYDQATQIINPTLTETEEEEYIKKAKEFWGEQTKLLKKVYRSPSLRHHIQATITDIYWWGDDTSQGAIILQTSFATLAQFKIAQKELGWDYSLDSLQVGQCESCDEYYLEKDGYTTGKQGFCSLSCQKEDEFLKRVEAEDWEEQYAEHVVDSDPYDTDTYIF